jgi:hypothetical protein
MATEKTQNFANHARFIPLYHVVTVGILFLNVIYGIYRVFKGPSVEAVIVLLVAVALFLLAVYARVFALTVQDRVIRLEMRLRMREILPADLYRRGLTLTPKQLVALRFASDAELPALCAKVLDDNIQDQKAIKQMVKDWQADYLRA